MTDTLNTSFIQELQRSKVAIVGIGMSGMSVLRFLLNKDIKPKVFDSRLVPPIAEKDQVFINLVERQFGEFKQDEFRPVSYTHLTLPTILRV